MIIAKWSDISHLLWAFVDSWYTQIISKDKMKLPLAIKSIVARLYVREQCNRCNNTNSPAARHSAWETRYNPYTKVENKQFDCYLIRWLMQGRTNSLIFNDSKIRDVSSKTLTTFISLLSRKKSYYLFKAITKRQETVFAEKCYEKGRLFMSFQSSFKYNNT